jgi:hypothetical protein
MTIAEVNQRNAADRFGLDDAEEASPFNPVLQDH